MLLLIFGGWRLSSSSSLFFDLRTGESRGFAFVRYKYADEAQKAVDRLDGMYPPISIWCFYTSCILFYASLGDSNEIEFIFFYFFIFYIL